MKDSREREWKEQERRDEVDKSCWILNPHHEAVLYDRWQAGFVEEQGPEG